MQIFEKEVPKSVALTEKELENLVFGTELTFGREEEQQEKSSENETAAEETRDEEINDFGFFIDTGNAEKDEKVNENGFSLSEEEKEEQEDDAEGEQDSSDEETMCAWVDGDQDYLESVNIQEKNRTRKLKRSFDEINVTGKEYEKRLREQFQIIHPTPNWAKIPENDLEKDDSNELLTTSKPLIQKGSILNPDKLLVIRAKDANQAEYAQVAIQSITFHPKAPVLLTAGLDKCIRIFHIDGKENPKVQSFYIRDMPIFSANFSPDGSQIISTGRRNFFYSLNVETGRNNRTTGIRGRAEKSFERSFVSPCSKYIAILGKDGYILLLSMGNKQLVGTCKMNTGVASIAFSSQNNQLWSLGFDGTVYIWDLDTKLCLHHFVDQGNIRGSSISISPNGQWAALGSSSGVVNLYETKTIMDSKNPEPVKAFMNLTTTVTTMLFHPQSELLVVASKDVKDSLKIIHIPTKRVVKNWPTSLTPLGYVFCAAFSPDGQFLAIGNDKGKVLLYRFEAFANLL